MNVPRHYRSLLLTYPRAWRAEYGEIAMTALLDAHAAIGRDRPSIAERARFVAAGMSRRVRRPRRRALPPLIVAGHRFDQTNGMITEREPTAAELSHARWSDHEDTPSVLPWGWSIADPTRPRSVDRPGTTEGGAS